MQLAHRPIIVRAIHCVLWSAPALIFFVLAWRYFAVSGTWELSYDFSAQSPFIEPWSPVGRTSDRLKNLKTGATTQQISGDPVYLTVTPPRAFDQVDVTMQYHNPDQSLVEFGVVTSTEPWSIQLFPFENKIIDSVWAEWSRHSTDQFTLLQRPTTDQHPIQQFTSVEEFLNNLPLQQRIGTYRVTPPHHWRDPNYQASDARLTIDRALRGPHQFLSYAADEDVVADFEFVDLNNDFNADPISLSVLRDGEVVHTAQLPDDGQVNATGQASTARQISVRLTDQPAGVYRYVIAANNDIVITRIVTDQERWVAADTVNPINNSLYAAQILGLTTTPTELFTTAEKLIATTPHPDGLQTITIDAEQHLDITAIDAPQVWYAAHFIADRLRRIELPRNDLKLTSTGTYFAFTRDSWFDPDGGLQSMAEFHSSEDFDYMIFPASYQPPIRRTTGLSQTIPIDFTDTTVDRKNIQFMLSSPGIADQHNTLTIKSMQFDFVRAPLWQRLRDLRHQ